MINDNYQLQVLATEMEQIEQKFLEDLKVLDAQIDQQFQQFSVGFNQISQSILALSSQLGYNEWGKGLAVGVGILGIFTKAFIGYKEAKKHNEVLDRLLEVKKEIAATKISSMSFILSSTTKVRNKIEQLCSDEMLNLKEEFQRGNMNDLREIMLQRLNIYRQAVYVELVSTFILAEYKSWISGEHTSNLDKPSMWDANAFIISNTMKVGIPQNVTAKSINPESLHMSTLFILADEQLYSYCDMRNDIKNSALSTVASIRSNKFIRKWMKGNKAPRKLFWKRFGHKLWTGIGGWVSIVALCCLAESYGIYWLFHDYLDWSLWVKWLVGIITAILVIVQIIFVMTISIENWEEGYKERENKFTIKMKSLAGYVHYIKPDFSKKSLFWSGISGMFR